jgi:hypothetical protein
MDDKALEEYLAGSSAVSRRYRELGADEVSPELDRLVLQRARTAVTRPTRTQSWRRWSVPVALAASVVLVVAILLEPGVREQAEVQTSQVTAPSSTPPTGMMLERKSEIAREGRGLDHLTDAVPPPPREDVVQIAPRVIPESPALAVPRATVPTQEATTTAKRAAQVDTRGSPLAAASVAPETYMNMPAPEVRAEPQHNAVPAPAEARRADAAASRERDAQESQDLSEVVVTGMRRAPAGASGAGPRNSVPRQTSYRIEEEAAAGQAASAPAPAAATQSPAAQSTPHDDPARWLEAIRQLRKDGKVREADQEWERFRAAFPDYAVAESDLARPKH